MGRPSVSVVVVSRGRADSLLWCLTALAGQHYASFEIVVVADDAGYAAVKGGRFAERVKLALYNEPNISAARNIGLSIAAGEIVAFIDDDAAAEPMWLHYLIKPFEQLGVTCAGGFVRGRNGITYQWTSRQVDQEGRALPVEENGGDEAFLPCVRDGFAVKTEGTNMAVRRDVLLILGGFDEGFRFYLDETDLNIRLAQARHKTALCPRAEVHHAYRASTRRKADRTVTDLGDVGASTVLFLRKRDRALEPRRSEVADEQAKRLDDQRRRNLISTEAVAGVLKSLETGFAEGERRAFGIYPDLTRTPPAFLEFTPDRTGSIVIAGRWWQRRRLRRQAAELAAQGRTVSLFLFAPTTRFHRVHFSADGYWEQAGGLFGKSDRTQPIFRLHSFKTRLKFEMRRVLVQRGLA